jgi:hypothetical protein
MQTAATTLRRSIRWDSAFLGGALCAMASALSPSASLKAQPAISSLLGLTSSNQDLGKLANDLVAALNSATEYVVGWASRGVCASNKNSLSTIQSDMNLLAIQKLGLANVADRYVVNDPTVTWLQFKTSIDSVTKATQKFFLEMKSESSARLFNDPSLSKPYRTFMVGLDDRKEGLLPRMERAAQKVDDLIHEGNPVLQAKNDVKREADALRIEATNLADASDTLGAFLKKLNCH